MAASSGSCTSPATATSCQTNLAETWTRCSLLTACLPTSVQQLYSCRSWFCSSRGFMVLHALCCQGINSVAMQCYMYLLMLLCGRHHRQCRLLGLQLLSRICVLLLAGQPGAACDGGGVVRGRCAVHATRHSAPGNSADSRQQPPDHIHLPALQLCRPSHTPATGVQGTAGLSWTAASRVRLLPACMVRVYSARTLCGAACTLLKAAGEPQSFWSPVACGMCIVAPCICSACITCCYCLLNPVLLLLLLLLLLPPAAVLTAGTG
jgi:hypothetical protein